MARAILVALVAVASAQTTKTPAVVEFQDVVTEEGGVATFKWTEGQDLDAVAAAFCSANVKAELQAQCAAAVKNQVASALAERDVPALELQVQTGTDEVSTFSHASGGDLRQEAHAFCAAHVAEEHVPQCAHAIVEGALQKAATPAKDPLEPEAPPSPWAQLLGPTLVSRGGHSLPVDAVLGKAKNVALLFAADWCKPCRDFVPKLKKYYGLAKRRGLEVVWVSASRSQANFDAYLEDMPWPAVPLATAQKVIQAFQTKGYPTLCFMDVDDVGTIITCDGVAKVSKDQHGLAPPYRTPADKLKRALRSIVKLVRGVLGLFGIGKKALAA